MAYKDDILATSPDNLIALWPLDETSGVIIHDVKNGLNGVAQGYEWGFPGIRDDEISAYLDGLNDYGNVLSAGLIAAFPSVRGSLLVWGRVANAGVWADGQNRVLAIFKTATNDQMYVRKDASANILKFSVTQSGITKSRNIACSALGFFMVGIGWDSDLNITRFFLNGLPSEPDLAADPLLGALSLAVLGATNHTPTLVTHGCLSHAAIWNIMLDNDQFYQLWEDIMTVTGQYLHTRIDYDGEKSNHGFTVTTLTAANFDAQAALRAAYGIAVAGICNGNFNKYMHGNQDFLTDDPSASPLDQREIKWLVQYHDATTLKKYRIELACADLAQLDPNDRAHANIGDAGVVDAFIAAFEAFALSETGHAVVVDEITFVGRNV